MPTVVRRTIVSTPERDSHETWSAISALLTRHADDDTKGEFEAVGGIAASIIAERTPANTPIVVTADGPRTRIYCLYDEDAIDGSDSNEEALGFDPLNGNWKLSLPCDPDDIEWVREALAPLSSRITVRAPDEDVEKQGEASNESALTLSPEKFLAS